MLCICNAESGVLPSSPSKEVPACERHSCVRVEEDVIIDQGRVIGIVH